MPVQQFPMRIKENFDVRARAQSSDPCRCTCVRCGYARAYYMFLIRTVCTRVLICIATRVAVPLLNVRARAQLGDPCRCTCVRCGYARAYALNTVRTVCTRVRI